MSKRVIYSDSLNSPIAHYSRAIRIGDLVYVGATAGVDITRKLAGSTPGHVDAVAQMRCAFDNLETALGLLGARSDQLVYVKSYITDVRDIAPYKEIYADRFADNLPSHAIVGTAGFPWPQAAIELGALAIIGEKIKRTAGGGVRAGSRHYATVTPLNSGGIVAASSTKEQTAVAIRRLSALLAKSGLGLHEIVNLHVTLRDSRDFPDFEQELSCHFQSPYPSLTIGISPLEHSQMRVQIESTAYVGGGTPIGVSNSGLAKSSPAMLAGDELFIGGQIGLDAAGGAAGDIEMQTRAAWRRIDALLEQADMSLSDVSMTTNYLCDWRDYKEFNAGYGASLSAPYPPRLAAIATLVETEARVQINAIAHKNGSNAVILDARRR